MCYKLLTCGRGHDLTIWRRTRKDGKGYRCQACNTEDNRARRKTPAGKLLAKKHHVARQFGITPEEYFAFIASQPQECVICKTTDWGGFSKKPHVDHCHKTGVLRGLLCSKCNLGLGLFNDNPGLLTAAADYLNKISESG